MKLPPQISLQLRNISFEHVIFVRQQPLLERMIFELLKARGSGVWSRRLGSEFKTLMYMLLTHHMWQMADSGEGSFVQCASGVYCSFSWRGLVVRMDTCTYMLQACTHNLMIGWARNQIPILWDTYNCRWSGYLAPNLGTETLQKQGLCSHSLYIPTGGVETAGIQGGGGRHWIPLLISMEEWRSIVMVST